MPIRDRNTPNQAQNMPKQDQIMPNQAQNTIRDCKKRLTQNPHAKPTF